MSSSKTYITLCMRCNGTGKYDRGACFSCRPYGAAGWVRRSRRMQPHVQVTAIRNEAEGRVDWVMIYGASPAKAKMLVQRTLLLAKAPQGLVDSVQAAVLKVAS